jgi:hypothetical protein
MRLIHLQGYTLWLSATSKDKADAQYNLGTALEAAQVYRAFLDRLAQANDYSYSEFEEWNEGVAAYTQYRLAEAAAQNSYVPTAASVHFQDSKAILPCGARTIRTGALPREARGTSSSASERVYHLGMGKALALDEVYPAWKMQYFAAGYGSMTY